MTYPPMLESAFYFKLPLILLGVATTLLLSGCQIGYLLQSADGQYKLMAKKISFKKALESPDIDDDTKNKIKLVEEVKKFSEEALQLVRTTNYDSFVALDDKYVTYAVTASFKNKLEPYLWSFPIVGKVPYKGFFKKKGALEEAEDLKKEDYDVLVRGISAYSTLGWFSDPLLSSMTQEDEATLVETVIHETTHATVYIKNNAEFNERLATFVGEKGLQLFYTKKEGPQSPTLLKAKAINEDTKLFLDFMREEIKALDRYYELNKSNSKVITEREREFAKIKERFKTQCQPKLKTNHFGFFEEMTLNNAVLINYKIYYHNHEIFERLLQKFKGQWKPFFEVLDKIKKSGHPEEDLGKIIIQRG